MKTTPKLTLLCILSFLFIISVLTLSACDNDPSKTCQHQWVEADCLYPKTCRICYQTEGAALGHNFNDTTCTTPKTCIRCNLTEGNALGHTEETIPAVAPTCTATGLTQDKHCSVCGEVLVAQETVDALGHDWGNPTCTTPRSCLVCFSVDTNCEPLGHDFVQGECIVCGADDPDYMPPTLISTTYNIYLENDSYTAYITMIGGETIVYEIEDANIVLCEWGDFDGDIVPLTFTPVSSGSTFVTVYIENYDVSITIHVSVEMTETDIWTYNYYVDSQFGYETDEWYLTTIYYIEGTFSNSSTTNDELYVELLYDCNDEISIFLYEYANLSYGLVKNIFDTINYYEIAIRNDKGQVYSVRGQMHPSGDRIYIIDTYHDEVFNLMKTSDNLQFFIQNEAFPTTQYRFDVDMNNFNDVLDDFVEEHEHNYTTLIIEPTCIEQGYTMHSCVCGDAYYSDYTPTIEHTIEHGICIKCNTTTDAYSALAYYVFCNGTDNENGEFYIAIKENFSSTKTFIYYIYTNSDASTVSFRMYETDTSTPNITYLILNLNADGDNHEAMMEYQTSWGVDLCIGQINNTFNGSKSDIYNYEYDLVYTTDALVDAYKGLFASDIGIMLCGLELYLLPDFVTLSTLGFTNF